MIKQSWKLLGMRVLTYLGKVIMATSSQVLIVWFYEPLIRKNANNSAEEISAVPIGLFNLMVITLPVLIPHQKPPKNYWMT